MRSDTVEAPKSGSANLIYSETHRWVGLAVLGVLCLAIIPAVREPSWIPLVYWLVFGPFAWYLVNERRVVADGERREVRFRIRRVGWEKRFAVAYDEIERIGIRRVFEIDGSSYETCITLRNGTRHAVTFAGWWNRETHERLCREMNAAVFGSDPGRAT